MRSETLLLGKTQNTIPATPVHVSVNLLVHRGALCVFLFKELQLKAIELEVTEPRLSTASPHGAT